METDFDPWIALVTWWPWLYPTLSIVLSSTNIITHRSKGINRTLPIEQHILWLAEE
jgi:hypothetical protein